MASIIPAGQVAYGCSSGAVEVEDVPPGLEDDADSTRRGAARQADAAGFFYVACRTTPSSRSR
jgi:hypothetical protein